ncbi:MAG: hypothetical protein WCH99_20800 [Verrucomicrobiota bacterium]
MLRPRQFFLKTHDLLDPHQMRSALDTLSLRLKTLRGEVVAVAIDFRADAPGFTIAEIICRPPFS